MLDFTAFNVRVLPCVTSNNFPPRLTFLSPKRHPHQCRVSLLPNRPSTARVIPALCREKSPTKGKGEIRSNLHFHTPPPLHSKSSGPLLVRACHDSMAALGIRNSARLPTPHGRGRVWLWEPVRRLCMRLFYVELGYDHFSAIRGVRWHVLCCCS